MNLFRNCTIFTQSAALCTAVSLLASCAIPGGDRFDAYDDPGAEIGDSLAFEDLDLSKKVSSNLLRPPAEAYRVGPGDVLDIEIAERASTRATTTVMPDGMLYFDVAEGINVKGKTVKEVSEMLTVSLSELYPEPVVTINLSSAQSHRFWVLGQVKKPGAFPINRPTTVVQAISEAGGLHSGQNINGDTQETVDLDRSILIRNGKFVPVNFRDLIEKGDMSQNIYVEADDYLYMPSIQHRAVYVLGAVQTPGPIYFDNDPTVLSAVALAGGPRKDAIVTKALIIRGSVNDPRVAVVNIHNIIKGNDRDARLVSGDIVWVPNTVWTSLRNYAEAAIITAAQAVAVQGGLAVLGKEFGGVGVTINAGRP